MHTVDPLVAALAARRIELGWEPMKLGRELGWNGGQILQVETGGNPRLSTLRRMADAMGCDLVLTPKDGNE